MARQITLRGVSPRLAEALKQLARARGESVNTTMLRLLEKSVGIHARRERLERYVTWTDEDVREFDRALASQRQIDDELWR